MEFSDNKPIYKQIIDHCCQQIVEAKWLAGERIPSTKELAVELAVNNRTVMKAYDEMSASGVIYQKRGMGYYVSEDAMTVMLELFRKEFREQIVPDFLAKMRTAKLELVDVVPLLYLHNNAVNPKEQ